MAVGFEEWTERIDTLRFDVWFRVGVVGRPILFAGGGLVTTQADNACTRAHKKGVAQRSVR